MFRELRIKILFSFIAAFAALVFYNASAHAEMKPAKPDSTVQWDNEPAAVQSKARILSVDNGPVIADISYYQGNIDWKTASKALDLAIIRTQSGSSTEDIKHAYNEEQAIKYGVPFGVYAFNQSISSADAKVEAANFYKRANKNTNFYVVDVEKNTSKSGESMRTIINSYVAELRKHTDKKIGVYIAHHLYNTLNVDTSKFDFVWIPRYNTSNTPPAFSYDLWQYTDQGRVNGISTYVDLNRLNPKVDLEYFTKNTVTESPAEPSDSDDKASLTNDKEYYATNPKKIVLLKKAYQYETPNFTDAGRKSALTAGTIVDVESIAYTSSGTPLLQLANGYYITANKDFVQKVITAIDDYHTVNPKKIVMLKKAYQYATPNYTDAGRKSALKAGTVADVKGIAYTASGTPRLQLANGYYITANKDFVLKTISSIDQYYTIAPKKVVILKKLYEYSGVNYTAANKKGALNKNKTVTITGILYTSSGTPRLKTDRGTYITANKSFVKAK